MFDRFNDQTITPNALFIWVLWLGGFGVLLFDSLILREHDDVGHLGLALIAGAVCRHILCRLGRLEQRQRDAFNLGHEAGVRSVRSIR